MAASQTELSGIVLNKSNNRPVEYAAVYINGTTVGTYTDSDGRFHFNNLPFSGQIVVSHIAYHLESFDYHQFNSPDHQFFLSEKNNFLQEFRVYASGKRTRNIKDFRNFYFGKCIWQKTIKIINDSVLFFHHYNDTLIRKADDRDFDIQKRYGSIGRHSFWSHDSAEVHTIVPVTSVYSKEPLLLNVPMLGYQVFLDLKEYKVKTINGLKVSDIQSFSRFEPLVLENAKKRARVEENRLEAYYNSSRHFCKSLYDNKLKENGYLVSVQKKDDSKPKNDREYFDLNEFVKYDSDGSARIVGLKGKVLEISYLGARRGRPIDLTKHSASKATEKILNKEWDLSNESLLIIQHDTCVITPNGIVTDNKLLFEGKIGLKKTAALLPDDYFPEDATVNLSYIK